MKKMMFLMLTLLIMGAANVNAQVQIGGTKGPDKSAVLDLNGDAGTATGGLALPRVELANDQSTLNGVEPQPGTVVYNTGSAQLAAGTYVWTQIDGSGGAAFTGISVNNTGANSTIGGTGTPASPLTVNVNANGITATQIANNAVTTDKLNALAVTGAKIANNTIAAGKLSTVASDSGKVLVSNGSTVTWSVRAPLYINNASVIKGSTLATQPSVTWVKVFDDWLNVDWAPYTVTVYGITGLKPFDLCLSDARDYNINAQTDRIGLNYNGMSSGNGNLHVRCYRPSL